MNIARQSTAVAIGNRAVLIEGPSGSGKSSLALALIDRGAVLVGDDGVIVAAAGGTVTVSPHPRTRGLIEARNLGLLHFPVVDGATAALVVALDAAAPRFIEQAGSIAIEGIELPHVTLTPHGSVLPLIVELALDRYGLRPG